jgi:3-hydroxybutyryl-CoA dehydrogenase
MSAESRRKTESVLVSGDRRLVEEFTFLLGPSFRVVSFPQRKARAKKSIVGKNQIALAAELSSDREEKKMNLRALESNLKPVQTILTSSVLVTVAEQAGWVRHPERLVGIGAFPTLMSGRLIELAAALSTSRAHLATAVEMMALAGKEVSVVQDRVGMVLPRILCMLINETAFALTEEIASPQDIDTAMKLGTNYPLGPVEWGKKAGFSNVLMLLNALQADLQEERYRVAPLLKQLGSSERSTGSRA